MERNEVSTGRKLGRSYQRGACLGRVARERGGVSGEVVLTHDLHSLLGSLRRGTCEGGSAMQHVQPLRAIVFF